LQHDTPIHPSRATWVRTHTILVSILIVLLVVTAATGLLGRDIYEPFALPKYIQESRAQDLITLALGVPLLVVGLLGLRCDRAWAVPLLTGVLAYELYVYALYVIGGIYSALFLPYVAVTSLSLYGIIGLLVGVDAARLQRLARPSLPRRWIGAFFAIIALVFAIIWIGQVITTIRTGIVDSGHVIFCIDLVIVLPAFGIAAVKLFRREAFGDVLAGLLLLKFDSLCLSIALGQLFRSMASIEIEAGLLGVFIPLGVVGLIMTSLYLNALRPTPTPH